VGLEHRAAPLAPGGEDLLTNSAVIRFLRVPAVPALSGEGEPALGRGRAARVLGVRVPSPPRGPHSSGKGEKPCVCHLAAVLRTEAGVFGFLKIIYTLWKMPFLLLEP